MILTEAKNLHLEHLEDEIINLGQQGVLAGREYITGITSLLQGAGSQSSVPGSTVLPVSDAKYMPRATCNTFLENSALI